VPLLVDVQVVLPVGQVELLLLLEGGWIEAPTLLGH
jgi:hypothetical protein